MSKIQIKFQLFHRIICFDTEHSKADLHKIGMRILKMTQKDIVPCLTMYTLRGLSPPCKRLLIWKTVLSTEGRSIIVIDNLRDLLHNINDQTEALATILMIQNLCDLGHHVILILHA